MRAYKKTALRNALSSMHSRQQRQVAEKLSPTSNNSLMTATFTPMRTKLKPFNIPKNLVPSTQRTLPTEAWYRDSFPAPSHKEQFVIGCANAPKVKDTQIEERKKKPK